LDLSGNGNHANLGSASIVSSGRFRHFDSQITTSPSVSTNDLGPSTMACWVNNSLTSSATNRFIFSKTAKQLYIREGGTSNQRLQYFLDGSGGDLLGNTGNAYTWRYNWTHFAVTWDGTVGSDVGSLFVNGVKSGSIGGSGTPKTDAPYSLVIGDTDLIFDDVRVYARVLSAGDIRHLASKRGVLGSPRQPYDPLKRTVVRVPAAIPAATVVGSIKKPTTIIKPSYQAGYARNASESENPKLWDGLVGAWMPSLGVTGETLRDVSGNGNHGTLTNMDAATDWVATSRGLALDFNNGKSYETVVTNQTSGSFNYPFTAGCWVKDLDVTAAGTGIISKATYTNSYQGWILRTVDFGTHANKLLFWLGGDRVISSQYVIGVSGWQFLLGRWDGVTASIFINGVKDSSASYTGTVNAANTPIRIGSYVSLSDRYMRGKVFASYVWERSLSDAEIKQIYVDSLAPFRKKQRVSVAVPAAVPTPSATYHPLRSLAHPLEQ
jgi:hypothetical protein